MLDQYYKKYSISPIGEPILNWHILLRNRFDRTESLKHWNKREMIGNGIVNQVYKTNVDSGNVYTVKLLEKNSKDIGINRINEKYNSEIAYLNGVGPRVIELNERTNVLVNEYLDGKVLTNNDLNKKTISKIIKNMKKLHNGPDFLEDFDIFEKLELFINVCKENNYKLPGNFLARKRQLRLINKIRKATRSYKGKTIAPCHNDLWASNIIEVGNKLKFIDYEFSGNTDVLFELAYFWNESDMSEYALGSLVAEYFGKNPEGFVEICKLYAIVADYTWAIWGIIQSHQSKLEYDFTSYSHKRYNKAIKKLNKRNINNLLYTIL